MAYVSKSSDARTIFSRRRPEYTHEQSCTHPCIPGRTPTHKLSMSPAHTCAHLRTNAHTCTHPGIPAHTPQIPADTINLINHVKLYINRPNTKKADRQIEDRKKKEQEFAEAISGLKKSLVTLNQQNMPVVHWSPFNPRTKEPPLKRVCKYSYCAPKAGHNRVL